jgi:hypothetical protein
MELRKRLEDIGGYFDNEGYAEIANFCYQSASEGDGQKVRDILALFVAAGKTAG